MALGTLKAAGTAPMTHTPADRPPGMPVSDRAIALAPHLEQLLYNDDVQAALRRAVEATRDACGRARGKSAGQAAEDKGLQRRLRDAVQAAGEVWAALSEPAPRRKPGRRGRKLALLGVTAGGAYLAVDADARAKALAPLGKNDAATTHQSS
jgi:hypothetical protein